MDLEVDLKAALTCPGCKRENTLRHRASDTIQTPEANCYRAAIDLCSCRACERACYFVRLDLDTAAGVRRRMFGPFVHGESGPGGNLWLNAARALIGRVGPVLAAENQ